MNAKRLVLVMIAVLSVLVAMTGCKKEEPTAGAKLDKAASDMKAGADQAAKDAKAAADAAAKQVNDAATANHK